MMIREEMIPILIFMGIICFPGSIDAQISPIHDKISLIMDSEKNIAPEKEVVQQNRRHTAGASPGNLHYAANIDHRSWRAAQAQHLRHKQHLVIVHGIVNIVGWGILLPIGVIAARFFKRQPLKCDDWFALHILSKISGFIMGTVGWGLGMSIRNSAREPGMSAHGILGTIIFAFTTIQVISAVYLFPNVEEYESKNYCAICHCLLGYVLIVLIFINIYQGIENQNLAADNKWKWCYGVMVGAFVITFLALEVLRWIKFDSNDR